VAQLATNQTGPKFARCGEPNTRMKDHVIESSGMMHLWVTMGSKFYTIRFKNRIGLGSDPISIHF
jgi:hypothetical protein